MTRNLLFDLELLAHADDFVGTTKSGLSPIIEVRNLLCSPSDISTILNGKLSEEVVWAQGICCIHQQRIYR